MQPRHDSAANRSRLAALDRLASAGDSQAAGEARRLRHWMQEQAQADEKRQDDRVKVLVGAAVLHQLATGRPVELQEPRDLLHLMNDWLVRPGERQAVMGAGSGSEALRRVLGLSQAGSLSDGPEVDQGRPAEPPWGGDKATDSDH